MTQIRTPDQRLRVFVSSTMNEMADERAATKRAIQRLHLTPVMFELGARPYPPRELYLAYLRQSDVFIGIYGQQYGFVAPGSTVSGLEDEFLSAADKPRLVYVQSSTSDRDPRLADMLHRMEQSGVSYHTFKQARDLARLVSDDLAVLVSDRFATAPSQPPQPPRPPPAPVGRDEPGAANRFVGRTQELAALRRLLADPQSRLVTLVGPGGIGKTRLALQFLATAAPEYDTAAVAELDQVPADQPLVAAAIASALGVPEATGTPLLDSVVGYLGSRRVLLLLDGFEHLVGAAAALVADLVARTTRLTVLVTSRENLHLTGERVFDVPPLALPSWSDSTDAARRSDAVQLFVDRATAAGAAMVLDDAQLRAVVEICQRLDGLPLAIELAASRARMLDLPELARRLDMGLATLTGGARDLPPRQQALRSTIAWSYDLLDETEQRLFARLGVFAGSFALDAAEALCGDERVPDVFNGISSLVDKALLRPDHSLLGQPRFGMLQTIREFADDLLVAAGERDRLRDRHADFYRDLVVDGAQRLRTGDMRSAIELHMADDRNIQAALQRYLDARDGDAAAQMGLASWPVRFTRGGFTEGQESMERVLAPGMRLSEESRTDATLVLGLMIFERGEYDRSVAMLQPVLDQYVQRGDARGVATAAVPIGVALDMRGSRDGDDLLRRAVDGMRRLNDRWGLGFALLALGTVLVIDHREGDAIGPLEEGADIARAGSEEIMLSNALIGLGSARMGQGDLAGAKVAFDEGLRRAVDFAHQETVARAFDAIAAMAGRSGDASDGAILFGAAEGLRRSVGGTSGRLTGAVTKTRRTSSTTVSATTRTRS